MFKIETDNGKYTFTNDNGVVGILRYGEKWDTGNKALLSLLEKVERYEEALKFGIKYLENSEIRQIQLVRNALNEALEI